MCACLHELFFERCHSTLSWWMVILISLLMLNEPCSSCRNWMLFMLSCSALSSFFPRVPPSPLKSHHPLLLPAPPFPSLVCEVGRWRLMNEGSLTSHASYEASGAHNKTRKHTAIHTYSHAHTQHWGAMGKGRRVTFATKMLTFLSSCWLHSFLRQALGNHQEVHAWWGAGAGNAKLFKAEPSLGNLQFALFHLISTYTHKDAKTRALPASS